MNLADIRRKAQAEEAQAIKAQAALVDVAPTPAVPPQAIPVQVAPAQVAPAQAAPVQAAPAEIAPIQAAPAEVAPAPVAPAPAQPAPAQVAPAQPAPEPPVWQAPAEWEPPATPVLPVFAKTALNDDAPAWDEPQDELQEPSPQPQCEESNDFDPAAVILRGRETASSEEVVREAEQAEASLELLCFRVATEDYAISIMDIKEIIKPREVTEVPRVPSFVRGILSLRGIIIPVFDMRLRLGLPAGERSERERIVVVKRQGGFCGVLVDQVVQVVRIAETKLEAPPVVLEGIDREFILGIGRVAGKMLILLDMEKVLDISLL
jgi:purine-binding chemotaxis protein CheW